MKRRGLVVVVSVVALAAVTVPLAGAQTPGTGSGVGLRFAPGVTFERAVFGDNAPKTRSTVGITLGGQVCGRRSDSPGFLVDATFRLNQIQNPHFDERFRVLDVQAGPQWGRQTYLRVSGGVALQFWSGKAAASKVSLAFSGGVAVGREMRLGSQSASPEVVGRFSVAHGIVTTSLGGQVPIGSSCR